MKNKALAVWLVAALVLPVLAPRLAQAAETVRQPVFLVCPHTERYSAWSVVLEVDKNDPSKVVALVLEKLVKQNSKDAGNYEHVLAAQRNPATERETLGTLPAASFGSGQIRVEKDDALHLSAAPAGDGNLRLVMSMRTTSDTRFDVGNEKGINKRDILFTYDQDRKAWKAIANKLVNSEGADAGNKRGITGIVFPVKGTGVYRIVAVMEDGEAIIIVDR